jgi:hypothetical protein
MNREYEEGFAKLDRGSSDTEAPVCVLVIDLRNCALSRPAMGWAS